MIGSVSGAGGDPDALGVPGARLGAGDALSAPRGLRVYADGRRDPAGDLSWGELDPTIAGPTLAHAAGSGESFPTRTAEPGNQIQINVHLKGGPSAASELARSFRHLLLRPAATLAA